MQIRKRRLLLAALGIVLGAVIVVWADALSGLAEQWRRVLELVRQSGAPVFFMAMTLLPLVGFPLSVFIFSAGPLFAPSMGLPMVMATCVGAVLINISMAYWMAAKMLRPTMERFIRWLGYNWPQMELTKSWEFTLVMRLLPGMPFFVQSYALGMTGVKFRVYLGLSMLVAVGQIVAGVLVGDGLLRRDPQQLAIAGGVFALLGLCIHLLRKRLAARRKLAGDSAQKNSLVCTSENSSHLAASMKAIASNLVASDGKSFVIHFGTHAFPAGAIALPIPVLAGAPDERIFPAAKACRTSDGFRLFEDGDMLIGIVDETVSDDIEHKAYALYLRMLKVVGDRHLVRIWNYVPDINKSGVEALENYRLFCRGRSHAFERAMGEQFCTHLPAASAVGGVIGRLVVVFVATRTAPQHVENPDQVPAYKYPENYGPRPPSFARASRVKENGIERIFFSGTAAIKGHQTMAVDDLNGQIACMLDNMNLLSNSFGLPDPLGLGAPWTRHCKIYLRHASDLTASQRLLHGKLYLEGDHVTWLHSDICRADLLIEAELTLTRGKR